MLPNSTERAVTVSGTAEAVTACIKVVCNIMLEVCSYAPTDLKLFSFCLSGTACDFSEKKETLIDQYIYPSKSQVQTLYIQELGTHLFLLRLKI